MKKVIIRTAAMILLIALSLTTFVACSFLGKTMLVLEKDGTRVKMSVNVFQFYLSRMKGMEVASTSAAENDSYWDAWVSQDGTTRNQQYTNYILEEAKTYLAALYLFEKNGYRLPDATVDAIDAQIEHWIEVDANGSKAQFDAILAVYGANRSILRETMLIEAKIRYLKDALFGTDGSLIADNLVDDYYTANYRRFKQVFL